MKNKIKNFCVYWVKNKINAPNYIGRTTVENINNGYPTKSKSAFLHYIKIWCKNNKMEYNPDDFWVEIQQVFGPNKDAARWCEEQLCRLNDAVDSDNFFNKNYGDVPGPKVIAKKIETWANKSPEEKAEHSAKISALNKGKNNPFFDKTHSAEVIAKLRVLNKGKNNPNYGKNPLENKTEKELAEIKVKRRAAKIGRKYFYNPITDIAKMIYPDQIDEYTKNGYIPGMRPKTKEAKAQFTAKRHATRVGRKGYYNSTTDHCVWIKPEQIAEYKANGYQPGMRPRIYK